MSLKIKVLRCRTHKTEPLGKYSTKNMVFYQKFYQKKYEEGGFDHFFVFFCRAILSGLFYFYNFKRLYSQQSLKTSNFAV
jgi:hypothetical protein